jgi:hypothetical protein
VSQCASTQVGVHGSRVCLEKLSGGVDGLIVRFSLYYWKDWTREARHDFLDGGVLHLDMLGGPDAYLLCWRRNVFGPGGKENGSLARGL